MNLQTERHASGRCLQHARRAVGRRERRRYCTHPRGIRPTTRRRCCLEQPPPAPLSQHDLTMVEALLALQLIAGPPGPLDRVSAVVGLIGLTADGVTTYRFLHDGSGCEESNPFLGPFP